MTILRENYITDGVENLAINEDGSITTTSSGSPFQLEDSEGNKITSSALGNNKRGLDITVLSEDGFPLQIGPDGRLHVTLAPPRSTDASIHVRRSVEQSISGHAYYIDTYTIPNNKILLFSKIIIGGQAGSSYAAIYMAPNGVIDNDAEEIIDFYVDGNTVEYDMDSEFTGDGTKALIVKLKRLDKGKRKISLFWEGYLADGT